VSASSLAERILAGEAPENVRLAAARGAVPLPATELLRLQVLLRRDQDESVRRAAQLSLGRIPTSVLEALRDTPETDEAVLEYLLEERADLPRELRRDLAAHPSTGTATLERLAARDQDPEVLEALVANQQLLRARPGVAAALGSNPALTSDQHRRLRDLVEHLPGAGAPPTPEKEPEVIELPPADELPSEAPAGDARAAALPEGLEPAKDPRLAALGIDAEVEAMLPVLDLDVGELFSRSEILGGEELAADPEHCDAYHRILQLNAAQKLRLALFGTREERMILVRDTNRVIAIASINNPRLSEQEVELVSVSRNVLEDVLLAITRRKDAMKRYGVVHNLVRNPKVPLPVSMRLIPRLHDRDLKLLIKNKNVAEGVRVNARKQMMAREKRQKGVSFRKGH
jgi:hypothetical protein